MATKKRAPKKAAKKKTAAKPAAKKKTVKPATVRQSKKARGLELNKKQLAQFFDKSPTTIDRWMLAGMPYLKKGGPYDGYIFDSAAVVDWKLAREKILSQSSENVLAINVAKTRKESALAHMAELELDEKRGLLVSIESVKEQVAKVFTNFRNRIISIPDQVARELKAAKTINEVKIILNDSLDNALREFSKFDPGPTPQDAEGSDSASSSPAAPGGKRVGRSKSAA